jgi:hypothetical protein
MVTLWLLLWFLFVRIGVQSPSFGGTDARVLARHEFSLETRYADPGVNRVFRENILLTLAYMRHAVATSSNPDWQVVNAPFRWEFTLMPGETVSYHDMVLPQFRTAKPLTDVTFSSAEGFLSDGYLVGDGTCHLASIMAWTAKDAGLTVTAPTNHDFATIAEVPKADGVAIYAARQSQDTSARQNLYITNTLPGSVKFVVEYEGNTLGVRVEKPLSGIASLFSTSSSASL